MTFDELGGWRGVLGTLVDGRDLTRSEASAAMGQILSGEATPVQIAGFIVALRMKGETVDEMVGMVEAMLAAAAPVELGELAGSAIDIVGTGGAPTRRVHALNVSTMASLVAAGAGARVCKHGNRRAPPPVAHSTCSMRSGCPSTSMARWSPAVCGRRGWGSASPAPSTRRCGTPVRCGPSWVCRRCSTFSGRCRTRRGSSGR